VGNCWCGEAAAGGFDRISLLNDIWWRYAYSLLLVNFSVRMGRLLTPAFMNRPVFRKPITLYRPTTGKIVRDAHPREELQNFVGKSLNSGFRLGRVAFMSVYRALVRCRCFKR
jgi:hypothetical protein